MLAVKNVSFGYGDNRVLEAVDLRVDRGELVGVVGPNGSGKTTLLKLITGVLRPSGGHIETHGKDLMAVSSKTRARLVSIVPQNPQLPLSFSVLDLVLMGRNPHLKLLQWERQPDVEIARRAMQLTETDHLEDRALATLSGGERQRAVVAMAIAQQTPLLLLDEPTSSLDLAHQLKVMDVVTQSRSSMDGAVLIAMHDLTLAAQYCERLVMLAHGRVLVEGSPEEVLTDENIFEVYGVHAHVIPHPVHGTPVVLPASDGSRFPA